MVYSLAMITISDNESHFIGQQTFQFQWLRLLDRQRVKLNDFPDT